MTRFIYGGGGDAEVNSPSTGLPRASAPAGVYNSQASGSGAMVTDILKLDGTPLAGTVTTDSFGQAIFQGPDGYTQTLWLDFGTGPRWGVAPKQLDQAHAGGQIIKDQRTLDFSGRAFTTKSALPTNTSDPLLAASMTALDPLVIPRFPSSATRDAAFPSPADGDRCYRTDGHARQQYSSAVSRWITEPALIAESVLGSTANAVTFSAIPQLWENLRILVGARCASSSQTHKWGVEVFAQLNGDSTQTDYMCEGWTSLDKIVSGTTTYNISTVDATGGSTTAAAPIPLTRNGFAGDLGARMGFLPGESTPSGMWGTIETVIQNYTNAHGPGGIASRSSGSVIGTTDYSLAADWRAGWSGNVPVTSLTVALFTGALMSIGSTVRLYGF